MSARRYKFRVTDMDALQKANPKAVEEITIPARTERKAVYTVIAHMLAAGLTVPGIKPTGDAHDATAAEMGLDPSNQEAGDSVEDAVASQNQQAAESDGVPAALRGMAEKAKSGMGKSHD